jgi:hypothetical protein
MTHRLSFVSNRHWLLPADPAQPVCAYRSAARKTTESTTICTAVSACSAASATGSAVTRTFSRTPDTAVAPTVPALSP